MTLFNIFQEGSLQLFTEQFPNMFVARFREVEHLFYCALVCMNYEMSNFVASCILQSTLCTDFESATSKLF